MHALSIFPRRPNATTIATAISTALLTVIGTVASADTGLRDIVVTANRHEADVDAIPATVTSLTRAAMDRRLPADTADLFADEADVAMPRDLRRHGATRINIRGIEDNRVIQLIDGVRLPDYYNGGGPTNFTMSASPTAMPDFLKRVEIIRGAASSLYGSDAIGGVVGFLTLAPADLLGANKTALRVRAGYTGANQGTSASVLGAARNDGTEFLLGYSHGSSREFANQGGADGRSASRGRPNPQRTSDDGLLAKLVVHPASGHKLTATLEGRDQASETEVLRTAASMPRVSQMNGDDHSRRVRAGIEWEHKPVAGFYDRLTAQLHRQDAETRNYNFQRRSATSNGCSAVTAGANNCRIEQDFFFSQETSGGGLQLETLLQAGATAHLLTFGFDLARVRVEELRDGRVWSQNTGFMKSLAGENYPLRDFAVGQTDTLGVFAQDEIAGLAGGNLALTPGIRLDRTRLTPQADALAQQVLTTLGRQSVAATHAALSPKLGATWKIDDRVSAYGQIARGFRAPNYNEVNGAFRNTAQLYSVVPNADLKPETSIGGELGLRHAGPTLRGQLAVFDNRYRNFIEQVQLSCPGDARCYFPAAGWRTNVAVNLARVRIYGVEARGRWDFAPGWNADAAIAHAQGTVESSGQALSSVEPTRLSFALAREAGAWGTEARLRAAARKSRVDDTGSGGAWFRTPGYGTVDLSAWLKLDRGLRATVAVNNLFDRKYWLWSDIRQADANNPAGVDFYSQPGRNLSIALQVDF